MHNSNIDYGTIADIPLPLSFLRAQLLGDAETARRVASHSAEESQSRKRARQDEDRDERWGGRSEKCRESGKRHLERAIQRCLVSGLYMNAARLSANVAILYCE